MTTFYFHIIYVVLSFILYPQTTHKTPLMLNSVMCVTHNKLRNPSSVVDNGNGRHECRSDSQCKVSHTVEAPRCGSTVKTEEDVGTTDDDIVMCSVHNQRRGPSDLFLQKSPFGLVYVCKQESPCQGYVWCLPPSVVASDGVASLRLPPYKAATVYRRDSQYSSDESIGARTPPTTAEAPRPPYKAATVYRRDSPAPATPLPAVAYQPYQAGPTAPTRGPLPSMDKDAKPREFCVIHQKSRLLRYLELCDGEYRCHRDQECDSVYKIAPPGADAPTMCAVHGKLRRADKVQLDPATNTYRCIAQNPCA